MFFASSSAPASCLLPSPSMSEGKLARWLNKVKVDPPFQDETPAEAPAPPQGKKLDRWLSRAKAEPAMNGHADAADNEQCTDKENEGLVACCNLIKLLEPEELKKVQSCLVDAMQSKGTVPDAGKFSSPPAQIVVPPLPKDANEATGVLQTVLVELASLMKEAVERERKTNEAPAPAPSKPEATATEAPNVADQTSPAPASGNNKLDRWLSRAKQPPPPSPPPGAAASDDDGGKKSKLDRWLSRAAQTPAPTPSDPPAAGAAVKDTAAGPDPTQDPLAFTRRCCDVVRSSWAAYDKFGGGASLMKEKSRLAAEKKALDSLMQMVYAIRDTPQQLDPNERHPPAHVNAYTNGIGAHSNGLPPLPNGNSAGKPVAQMNASEKRAQRVQENDPNALLQEFLKARRE
ncbi:hypothetical protein GUITHDRAFT_149108, partial [Guillardia theta CCMP2712]